MFGEIPLGRWSAPQQGERMADLQTTITRLNCPNCAQSGVVAWNTSGTDRTIKNLVKVSSGFHWEIGRTRPDELLILCDICDEIQP